MKLLYSAPNVILCKLQSPKLPDKGSKKSIFTSPHDYLFNLKNFLMRQQF